MGNILFFDTETNGLPRSYHAKWSDVSNWPRVVQLGFLLTDTEGNTIQEYQAIIQPDGWEIPIEASRIHGISQEVAEAEGVPMFQAVAVFEEALEQADLLVAHNIKFDLPIMGAEFYREEKLLHVPDTFCTMLGSTDYVGIWNEYYGGYKWPKLEELYWKLFEEPFEGAHDALADVKATAACYFKLKEKGIFVFEG
ncbi:hypothetical protein GCM10023331_17230 [Algivirga pacifica]|uniref:Exonuclease domain-containing protein n=2 Tax=Algivirga pacifica TaxID=1162670 RepID=A0ABP9D8C8_9BACT